jgi:hypothetical protein
MLKSEIFHEYRKHLDKLLTDKIGSKYKETNKTLSELLPLRSRIDHNYNKQRQLLETDDVNFSLGDTMKRIISGESPKRSLEIANKIRGKAPKLFQLEKWAQGKKSMLSDISSKVPISAKKGLKMYTSGRLADLFDREKDLDRKKIK